MIQAFGKPDPFEDFSGTIFGIGIRFAVRQGGNEHIFKNGILLQKMVILKDETYDTVPKSG